MMELYTKKPVSMKPTNCLSPQKNKGITKENTCITKEGAWAAKPVI